MMVIKGKLISEKTVYEFNKELNKYDIDVISDIHTTVFKDEDGNDVIMYSVIISYN